MGSTDLVVGLEVLADAPQLSVEYNPTSGGERFAVAGNPFHAQMHDASLTPSTFQLIAAPTAMTIDPANGLISWIPTGDQGGTQSVTVRATNSGGTADLTFDIPTRFTGAVTLVDVTGTTLLVPTAHWSAPTGEGAGLVSSYQIDGVATWGVGRTKQTHRVHYTVAANETSVLLTGLVTGKQYAMTVTPLNSAGNQGLGSQPVSFVSLPALPQIRWTVNGRSGGSSVPGEVIAGQSSQIVLTDQRPDPSTIELVDGPVGLTFDPLDNSAVWTPTTDEVTAGYGTTSVTFRATNDVGSVVVVVPVRVFFSGPVTAASTTRLGNNATAQWTPPANNVTPVVGYSITRKWTWSGRPRSVTWTVGNVTNITFPLYPTGAVSHKGITVTPIDSNGNLGVSSGLLLYGAPPNTLPPLAVNDSYNATEDVELLIDVANGVRANDIDTDGTPLINPLSTRLVSGPGNGTLRLDPDGSFSYSPNQNFYGTDTFTYLVNDGLYVSNEATVTLQVAPQNDAPTARYDYYSSEQDVSLAIGSGSGVLANDVEVDQDLLTARLVSGPSSGTVTMNPDGSFEYLPNLGFIGVDNFQYVASDGVVDSNTATVSVAVDSPFALNDSYATQADVPLVVDLAVTSAMYLETFDVPNAPSPLAAAGWSIVTGTSNPTTESADFAVEDNLNVNKITAIDESGFGFTSGHVFLEHDINELIVGGQGFGETFIYTDEVVANNDGNPLDLNGAYLFVDYANGDRLNPGPAFQFAIRTGESWFVAEQVNNVGAAGQSVGIATASSDPLGANVPFVPIQVSPNAFQADARILYLEAVPRALTAAELANVTAVGVLTSAQADGIPARFDNFAISRSNLPPSATVGVLDNDHDPNPDAGPLAAELLEAPANGTLTLNADGSFAYTPNAGFIGIDHFTYQANNGTILSNVATVEIAVSGLVGTPAPSVESVEINEGGDQRSNITSLTVAFDQLVNVPASAFLLTSLNAGGAGIDVPLTSLIIEPADYGGKTFVSLTFASGEGVTDRSIGNSLSDGQYQLVIDASQVTSRDGQTMSENYSFGTTSVDRFFRKFGDVNGNGVVDLLDFAEFRRTFGTPADGSNQIERFDFDGDQTVGLLDFAEFRRRFGT